MTRCSHNAFAIVAALMLTVMSFYEVVTIPAAAAPLAAEIA